MIVDILIVLGGCIVFVGIMIWAGIGILGSDHDR